MRSPANGTVAGRLGAVGGIASGFRPFSKGTVTISGGRVPHSMSRPMAHSDSRSPPVITESQESHRCTATEVRHVEVSPFG